MFKKDFTHGIIAGILASIAGIIYSRVYLFANEADFSKIVNLFSIIGVNLSASILIAFLHTAFVKWMKKNAELVFNLDIICPFFFPYRDSRFNHASLKYRISRIIPWSCCPDVVFPFNCMVYNQSNLRQFG